MTHDPDMIEPPPAPAAAAWDDLRHELARDVDRVSDRLRNLSQARLAAAVPPHASRAAAARATAQTLADASASLEASQHPTGLTAPSEPTWRTLPELGDFATGDQVAVTGHDLVAAARPAGPDDVLWARHGRRTAHEVLTEAAGSLAALRHLL